MKRTITALMIAGAAALAGCASQPEWKGLYCTQPTWPDYVQYCVYERTR